MSEASKKPSAGLNPELLAIARGIGGALLGAAAGVLVFILLLNFGVYAIAAIGALTGLGCSLLSQRRSLLLGVIYEACGQGGWRYDLMLLYPPYALILIGWGVRLIPLLRARPG